jgi:hypothetical protein
VEEGESITILVNNIERICVLLLVINHL